MSLRDIWRAAFASGEARGVEEGAAFRADVAARLDDEREEREARIRAEAYAQGREAGVEACAHCVRSDCAQARLQGAQAAVTHDRAEVYTWLSEHAPHGAQIEFNAACEALDEAKRTCERCGRSLEVRGAGVVSGYVKCACRPRLRAV